MKSNLSTSSVLVGLCCIGILMAGYMPDDSPLFFVESHKTPSERRNSDLVTRVSPDGLYVYHVVGADIRLYVRNPATGELTAAQVTHNDSHGSDETASCVSPDGAHFYVSAIAYHVPEIVWSFRRDQQTGVLTHRQVQALTQEDVDRTRALQGYPASSLAGMICSDDGKHLYATSRSDNLLLAFDCNDDDLTLKQIFQDDGSPKVWLNGERLSPWIKGAKVIDGLLGATSVLISPDDRFVYVSASMDQSIAVFQRDAASGRLKQIQFLTNIRPLPPPPGVVPTEMCLGGSMAFSPAADHIYDVSGSSVAVLARDSATGKVKFLDNVYQGEDSIPSLEKARSIVVSKSGRHVFVASTGDEFSHRGAITIFKRDATTGELEFLKVVDREEVAGACHLSLSPDGRHLYVSTWHQTLAVFAVHEDPKSEPL